MKADIKTELLIFLTPYIVEGTDNLKELTVNETNRTDLPEKAFSSQDVKGYLDTLQIRPDIQRLNPPNPEKSVALHRPRESGPAARRRHTILES